jgi:hypothetical protein
MPLERWQVKLEFERAGGKAARMRRWGVLIRGGKAAEGRRTPRRWRVDRWFPNHAKRLGMRQSSGASGRRAGDSQQDQESAENGTQDEQDNRPPPRLPVTEIEAEGEPAADSGRGGGNEGRSGVCFHRQTLPDASCAGWSAFSSNLVRGGIISRHPASAARHWCRV